GGCKRALPRVLHMDAPFGDKQFPFLHEDFEGMWLSVFATGAPGCPCMPMSLVSKKNGKTVFFFSGPHFSDFSETVFSSFFSYCRAGTFFRFSIYSSKQLQKILKT
ncbi:MAG: hypothetical protein VXY27_05300, partial [Thermoproteota archaeon]|nr:hypothetical protein [Thermoproteota archaeon]